ncbi:uncharacterized protein LOC132307253 [Cornus florida]|uniref:uncharacterized protein LOC132307253 n=1 Tax=Cornus florida TaxID=4283 RepID=UPI00289C3C6F|nr:uncharacterized protein LOC132307253 [Cornus florida]
MMNFFKRNAVLYNALMKEETPSELVEQCRQRDQYPEGPLHVLTLHGDTVLHMAAHTAKADFVNQLLGMLPENEYCKLTRQNAVGNTILHEAVAFDKLVPAAKRMLDMAPELSSKANKFRERPLFSVARYGQIKMFKFLDKNIESEAERKEFYQNDNKTTVLHSAVFFGHFGLLRVENLIPIPAMRGKGNKDAWIWRVPFWGAIRMKMVKYESAKELARFLVAKDNSSRSSAE